MSSSPATMNWSAPPDESEELARAEVYGLLASPFYPAPPDEREELARAEVYGLLASLFYAAPGPELYEQLRVAVTEAPSAGGFLEGSWSELVAASRRLSQAEIEAEYNALFGGVGKPE